MGSTHSSQSPLEAFDDDDREEEEEEEGVRSRNPKSSKEKVLEQEPEVLPCRTAASPLSPQPSAAGTPRMLGPSVKVWDPCNVLLQPPPSPPALFAPGAASAAMDRDTEVFLIAHGECASSLRPDLVGGRWSTAAGLTANGERQARALAVFLKSQGVRFDEVYSSPLDRARTTAAFICRELGFAEEQIQPSDALVEISQGQWEGCLRSEVYTQEIVNLISNTQPDFCAPSGESLRQVVFRMIEFLNMTVLRLPEKLAVADTPIHQTEAKELSCNGSANLVQDRDGPHWDLMYRLTRPSLQRKKSGKSRLQFVTTGDDDDPKDEFSPREVTQGNLLPDGGRNPTFSMGIFTHATPIKCFLTGLLDCSPVMSHRISIDDSSVTVLHHSLRTGWQIKRLNDTAHLRLL
ncbi:phosphoglycerate mutase [Musa troglodytarum]|uniref:Phosphoglycerate mutase n=1 Tax=Musa troglodytarum TaxID=320322 RepID=A0A9E7HFK6_9LILI|nr:phosphoglycerate mutase [Musa troglodytarum]